MSIPKIQKQEMKCNKCKLSYSNCKCPDKEERIKTKQDKNKQDEYYYHKRIIPIGILFMIIVSVGVISLSTRLEELRLEITDACKELGYKSYTRDGKGGLFCIGNQKNSIQIFNTCDHRKDIPKSECKYVTIKQ